MFAIAMEETREINSKIKKTIYIWKYGDVKFESKYILKTSVRVSKRLERSK